MTRTADRWERLPCLRDPKLCPTPDGEHVWEYAGRCYHPLVYLALCDGRYCAACGVIEHRRIAPFILTPHETATQQAAYRHEIRECPAHQQHWAISHPPVETPIEEPTHAEATTSSTNASVDATALPGEPTRLGGDGPLPSLAGARPGRVRTAVPDVRGDGAPVGHVPVRTGDAAGSDAGGTDHRGTGEVSRVSASDADTRPGRWHGGHWHIRPDADWRWREDGLLVLIFAALMLAVWRLL